MLAKGIFSFSHNVFQKLLSQMYQKLSLYGKSSIEINSVTNDKILNWSNFKAFAGNKVHVTEDFKFVLGTLENIVRKGENAGHQHFLLFPQCFPKGCSAGSLKVVIMWERVNIFFQICFRRNLKFCLVMCYS